MPHNQFLLKPNEANIISSPLELFEQASAASEHTLTCSAWTVPVWGRWLSGEQQLIHRSQGQNNRQHDHMVRGARFGAFRTWGRASGGVWGRTAPGRSSTTTWGRWRRRLCSPESVSGTRWAAGRDEPRTLWDRHEIRRQRCCNRIQHYYYKTFFSCSGTVCECQRTLCKGMPRLYSLISSNNPESRCRRLSCDMKDSSVRPSPKRRLLGSAATRTEDVHGTSR